VIKNSQGIARYHSISGFTHLFLVILIVLIGIGGLLYFSWQKGLIKTESSSEIPVSTFEKDISNWESYGSEKFGFALKHPKNFRDVETWLSGLPDNLPVQISFHQKLGENSYDGGGLFITVNNRNEYEDTYSIGTLDDYIDKVKNREKRVKIDEVTIDGQKAFKITYGDGKSMELLFTEPDAYRGPIEYIVLKDEKFYVFEYHTDNSEHIRTFDQILSTFKFTNQ